MKANHRGPNLANFYVLHFMHMNLNSEVNWIIYVKLNTYTEAHFCHFLLTRNVKININKFCRRILPRCLYVGKYLIFNICRVKVFESLKCKQVQKTWQN